MLNLTWRYLQAAHCFQIHKKNEKKQQQETATTTALYKYNLLTFIR